MRKRLYAVGIVTILTIICIVACSNNNKGLSSESTSSLGAKTETTSTGEEKHLSAEELDRILESQITQEDRDAVIKMEHRVRLKGTEEWTKSVDASVGDTLEFSIYYTNVSSVNVENVMLKVSLPDNMEYINGSTILIKKGLLLGARNNEDSILDTGVNIGNFDVNEDACVIYSATVIDKSLAKGMNRLISWSKISSLGIANQDNADTYVNKQ
jgi:conserved repeat protein